MTAYAIAGDLTFNPEKDTLIGADGKEVMLDSPFGDSLPQKGFDRGASVWRPISRSSMNVRFCELLVPVPSMHMDDGLF